VVVTTPSSAILATMGAVAAPVGFAIEELPRQGPRSAGDPGLWDSAHYARVNAAWCLSCVSEGSDRK
jgi:hypothetical protein